MSTSKDNSRKLPQNCVYQKKSDKKGNKKHQPSLYFFQISFPWDPSTASFSINQQTLFTQRSPRQNTRGAHSLHCQDATKPHLQSCWGRVMQNSFRSWTGKEAGKTVVRYSSWRDLKWHFMYRSDDMHGGKKNPEGLQWWGRKSKKLPQSILWKRSCGGKSIAVQENQIIAYMRKVFSWLSTLQQRASMILHTSEGAISEAVWECLHALIPTAPPRHAQNHLTKRFSFFNSHISPKSCTNYYGSEQPLFCKRILTMCKG